MPLARRALGRGVLAGLCAGLLAAAFFSVAAEPSLEAAIALEEQAHTAHAHDGGAAVSRETQRGVGLFLAVGVAGMTFGVLLAAAFLLWGGPGSSWRRALAAGGSLCAAITVVPWIKYPPDLPGVGSAETAGDRQLLYLVLIVCTALLVWAAVRVHRQLAGSGAPEHQRLTAAVGTFVLPLGALLAWLPGSPDPVTLPASLVWEFRIASLAGNLILWLALTLAFGLLTARAEARTAKSWAIKEASA